ncbi:MAG: (2Fe-2S)-binding protein [Acetobacter sp.]|nr:(2Fe-2S)-binding protein [Acetobacter sp.]
MTVSFSRSPLAPPTNIQVLVDGQAIPAQAGESVAAILLRACEGPTGHDHAGRPRAPYCMMGICFECVAIVDDASSVRTCLIPASDGMCVERQNGSCQLPEISCQRQEKKRG